jgi:predicted GNAT superfamily acetyltransferase
MLRSVVTAQRKIAEWWEKIRIIQENCPHKDVVTVHKGDTGNYDPSQDCYWTENKCPDCTKYWRVDIEHRHRR